MPEPDPFLRTQLMIYRDKEQEGKRRKYESEKDDRKADDIEVPGGGCLTEVAEERNELEKFLF